MRVVIHQDEGALAEAVADLVALSVRDKPELVLGLPTGRTPLSLYRALVRRHRAGALDFSRVRTFNLDEFAGLNGEDGSSFRAYMDRHLFSQVNLAPGNIGFLDGRAADLDAECERYEAELERAGGLDLVLLGLGDNGHLAFNEPAPVLTQVTHRTPLTRPTRLANLGAFGDDPGKVPREALTLGMGRILSSRHAVLLVTGEGKADIAARALEGERTTDVPASLLQGHPNAEAHLDSSAARGLRAPRR